VDNWIDVSDKEDTLSDVEVSTCNSDEEIMEGFKLKLRKASQDEKLITLKIWAKLEAN